MDRALVDALHARGFHIAVETNGTVPLVRGIDWVCVSPKAGTDLAVREGDELKLVFPQVGAEPERFVDLAFGQFFLQPMDGPRRAEYTQRVLEYCLANPPWRVSLQAHKLLGIR
jgi:organic radical activating enzyme